MKYKIHENTNLSHLFKYLCCIWWRKSSYSELTELKRYFCTYIFEIYLHV